VAAGVRIRWNAHTRFWEVVEGMRPIRVFSSLLHAEQWVIKESDRREALA
jgi:hypothetical protein